MPSRSWFGPQPARSGQSARAHGAIFVASLSELASMAALSMAPAGTAGGIRAVKRSVRLVLRLATRGWCTKDSIARELTALGVRRGGVLLVHSSLSSLGFVAGGARSVIGGLLEVLSAEGTLVVPTHTWD